MRALQVSLRLRLAFWYGGLTGVVVLLVCGFSYAIHSRTAYDELDITLRRRAEHVAAELLVATTSRERDATLAASLLLGTGTRVYGADGTLQLESANGVLAPAFDPRGMVRGGNEAAYAAIVALAPSPPLSQVSSPDRGTYKVLSDARGDRWRVYVLPLAGSTQYLAATLLLKNIDGAVASFGRLMLLMAALASVATFLAGWLVARGALRPVAALTAGAIAQSRAHSRRVTDSVDRDELGLLTTTFNEILGSQEEAHQAQQRFVAAASHELRAPLTVVQANLELLQRGGAGAMNEKERAQAVAEAYAEATRMARLVADLLSLARADSGVPLRREPVELDRVLIDVMGELRHLARGQRLEIDAFEPVMVQGDPDRIKQLVLILIENAIKYTGNSGRVTVSLRRSRGNATLEINDTGLGIGPEDLPRIFERFYRAEPARSSGAGGTGLGLPIARWIVEEHGGTVELASTFGSGTTATVRLPAST